ncbi:hypothetical protein DRN74_06890 [Candidatus Micrarchaeota archaeon]|nr:MAG: hypothetical protein DRN74_06875 [Candidatus Micrarchaeota archaeon]RLG19421.1 MAG: hypothetical protein DRN74_06890 [Candidatus Micrarchaeota archaeon]
MGSIFLPVITQFPNQRLEETRPFLVRLPHIRFWCAFQELQSSLDVAQWQLAGVLKLPDFFCNGEGALGLITLKLKLPGFGDLPIELVDVRHETGAEGKPRRGYLCERFTGALSLGYRSCR